MIQLPLSIEVLKNYFSKFSGVGERTATRMVLQLVDWDAHDRQQVLHSLKGIESLKQCKECFMYSDQELCEICNNTKRSDSKSICVVENVNDLLAIERSEQYRGLYHILGGVLNPLVGIGPEQLGIEALVTRIARIKIDSVILAVNPSVEGDATCSYIKECLPNCKVERIGFGIPMGGSLEYVDAMTISKAFENRKDF